MNYKKIIVLVVILGVLIGGYFLVKSMDSDVEIEQPTPTTSLDEKTNILDYEDGDITGITINYLDNLEFVFEYKEVTETVEKTDAEGNVIAENETKTKWSLENHRDLNVNQAIVDSVYKTIKSLTAVEVIEEQTDDLDQFGLESDYVKVDVYGKEDNTVRIGSKTLTGSGYYVMKEGDPKVYLVNYLDVRRLKVDRLSLQRKDIYSFDFNTVKSIAFERNGEKVFDAYKESEFVYQLTFPVEVSADYTDMQQMLEGLSQLSAIEYIAENPSDEDQYGLKKAIYVFKIETDDSKQYKIEFGKDADDGTIYTTVNDSGFIFKASTEKLEFLDKPIEDIVNGFVNLASIWEIEEVRVTMDGKTDISIINVVKNDETNATETEEYNFNGYQFDSSDEKLVSAFKKYYQGIIGITISKVEPMAVPKGTPEIIIEYVYKEESRNTKIELIPAEDDISYYVIRNGNYSGVKVQKRALEKDDYSLKTSYKNFIDKLPK